jgi:uncharacterized membrane protein YfcA
MDSTLGMGYGTTLTPVLLLMGFQPLQVVPAILLSELATGLLAGVAHHRVGNVDFRVRGSGGSIRQWLREVGWFGTFRRMVPRHLKISILIALCSGVGVLLAVLLAVNVSKFYLKLYIGTVILLVGIFTILTSRRQLRFSWQRLTGLGLLASFNKGLSGGGYGPLVTGGQILCGVGEKNAVGITSFAEGLTCMVGVGAYLALTHTMDTLLVPYLLLGAVLSVPLSAYTVKRMPVRAFRLTIGLLTTGLGTLTLAKTLL